MYQRLTTGISVQPTNNRYAVILCGGSGTRLWPLSLTPRPKQLLVLNGEQTMLQQTALRLSHHIDPSHRYTVTHEDHQFEVKGQLASLFPQSIEHVLAEPCVRNALPAIAWATYQIYAELANLVKDIVGFRGEIVLDNSKPDGTMRKLMDSTRLNQLGWYATTITNRWIS